MNSDQPSDLPQYALRFTERARSDMAIAEANFTYFADENTALLWLEGLYDALKTLAASPYRSPVPEQGVFRFDVRQIIYRRSPGSVAYRVLFHIVETGLDGLQVIILSVRHGAQAPITRAEARQIEAGQ